MNAIQIALAIINDRSTTAARRAALDHFISGADYHQAVHRLLPLVIAELKKPIYGGMGPFTNMLWAAAAEVLEDEIARARAEREAASC
jgi:hypothetical protein